MEKTYDPHAIEQRWYETWEQQGAFTPSGNGEPYCIMIPPPNVTGTLHMGHAFQDTIMDALTRYHRMCGRNTLWQPGTDHAGIATQMVVERQLNGEGKSRHSLGREAFIERIWQWREHSGGTITQQLRRMGASLDWQHERFTMDPGLSNAVKEVFVRLYEEGLIYRGKRLVNWDPVLLTAVSDLEVENHDEQGSLWHLRYPLADGSGHVIVATTRPETMLGDTGVAVHPEDERFKHLIGKTVLLPLAEREIPIIGDDYVDPEFGTGCLKITPAHDFNDNDVGKRHDLEVINIFTPDARINDNAPVKYQGLDRYEARKQVVADLKAAGLLEKIQAHALKVPRGDRSGAALEPYLTDQWYVKTQPLAEPSIEAVRSGRIKFVPANYDKIYYEWMENIVDWCISRQLWWGHRIPAWYDTDGTVYVGRSEEEVREKHNIKADVILSQDEDVLDTWFSSALWPFSTLGWPEQTDRLKTFYPTSVLVTGFDIIFFWVARMIMMGLKFMDGEVPFHEVYIHGLVRDAHGQKMSKSKGNILDPLDIIDGIDLESLVVKRTTGLMQPQMAPKIEKATREEFAAGIKSHGTDALRFTFASLATTGRDVVLDTGRIEGSRNFCNKLWNAARFVLSNTEEQDTGLQESEVELSLADRWIISRLQRTEQTVNEAIQSYRFDYAAQAIYEFTWNEYCDWYLELCKPILNGDASVTAKRGTRRTLVCVLEALLRLSHPLMPFISEEIWQRVAPLAGKSGATISLQAYPEADINKLDEAAEAEIHWLQQFLLGIRRIRAEMDIKPGKLLPVVLNKGSASDHQRLQRNQEYLSVLGRLESINWLAEGSEEPDAAFALVDELRILIPMAGLIDKDAELVRLDKEITNKQKDLERGENKLANEKFTSRAPEQVVAAEREKVAAAQAALAQLQKQRDRIAIL